MSERNVAWIMKGSRKMRSVRLLLLAVFVLALAPRVFAQGCALCYTTAAAAGPAAARSLDLAILVLLVPTLILFVAVLVFAFRRANSLV